MLANVHERVSKINKIYLLFLVINFNVIIAAVYPSRSPKIQPQSPQKISLWQYSNWVVGYQS